jgi:hypothetical protein
MRYLNISFEEALNLPVNIKSFYIQKIQEEIEHYNKEKESIINAWQKSGSSPPTHLAGGMK